MGGLTIERLEVLLAVSAVVALIARRLKLPYTVGLVVAGVVLGLLNVVPEVILTKELIFRLLLPPLIFEAAVFIHWKELKENFVSVIVLASAGVLVSTLIVAGLMSAFGGWTLAVAAVFGALIAATDPVSVIAMFKDLKIEGRLKLLVEAESLFNDGIAALLFSVAMIGATGGMLSGGVVAITLLKEVGGGVLCGALVAGIALFLAGKTDDHLVEVTFSVIAAFGAFLLADYFHCSGVLAVLVAGLLIGNLGDIGAITDHGREAVGAFWEFAAFVANSIIFFLIGVREMALLDDFMRYLPLIGLGIVASLLARAIGVYGVSMLLRRPQDRVEVPYRHVMVWGGLKGAISLALVLGLPANFPRREELIAVTFGVVAFSVIVQGVSMPWLMAKLNLIPKNGGVLATAVDSRA